MSNARLTVFFSGTHMTFEDLGFIGLHPKRRHNLNNTSTGEAGFYIFDGPAAATSNEHKPVEKIKYDKKQDDFLKASQRRMQNEVGNQYRWANGSGMKKIREAAYQIILDRIIHHGVRDIDLFGFSRGGAIALNVGAILARLDKDLKNKLSESEIDSINVNIYVADPVAGKTNNVFASRLGPLSRFVKKCIVGLATNESVPGFHPRGILSENKRYNIQFGTAKYAVLPFPEDHMMCYLWMKDIFLRQITPNETLSSLNQGEEKHLIERRLGLKKEVKWTNSPDETRAYRLIHFFNNPEKYSRTLIPDLKNVNSTTIQTGIETFFKFISTQHFEINIGHTSLQNDSDSEIKNRTYENKKIGGAREMTKKTQEKYAKSNNRKSESGFSDRACKIKLAEFTNTIFVNLLHESMFKHSYPNLHHLLLYRDLTNLDNAMNEFKAIDEENYPFTKMYIETALLSLNKLKIKPIEQLKSTNAKDHDELINLVIGDLSSTTQTLDQMIYNTGLTKPLADNIISFLHDDDCKIIKLKSQIKELIEQSLEEERKTNMFYRK